MSDLDSRSPFTSKGFILGAVLVAALIVAAVVIAMTSIGGGGSTPAATTETAAAEQENTSSDSVCGLPGFESSSDLTTAPETDWVLVGTMAAPSSEAAGPGVVENSGFRSCFAHTGAGALFAVANFYAMGTDGRLLTDMNERSLAPGPGRDAAIEAAPSIPRNNSGITGQFVGYRLSSYTPDEATVDIAFRFSNGSLISFPTPVVWVDGDWKMSLTDEGQPPFRPVALQSLGGFTAWAGTE